MGLEKRLRLVNLLTEAAELEHSLSCQYLYAAFTLKNQPEEGATWEQLESLRRWKGETLLIARQEMEHLGLVANLLTAIGEAPYFTRPDFPTSKHYYPIHLACELVPWGEAALERFLRFEEPATLSAEGQLLVARLNFEPVTILAARLKSEPVTRPSASIAQMYGEIRALFVELGAHPQSLFVGPATAQQSNSTLIPVPLRGIQLKPGTAFYNVLVQPVTDLKSALATIDQIVVEGEGSPQDRASSHFGRFGKMLEELRATRANDPSFEPARLTIANPRTAYPDLDPTGSTINVESTNRVSQLFDLGYGAMLLMLVRFFAHTDETVAELAGLQGTAFFPLMTNFIRPVGEMLTYLKARDDSPLAAGPSFHFARQIAFLPHKQAAWKVLAEQLGALETMALAAHKDLALPEEIQKRLELVYENVGRMRINFTNAMRLKRGA